MNVNTITLDVSKEPAHEPTIYLGQGDKNGTTLVVNLFDNGSVLDLTDKTVSFLMRTPGGTDYYQSTGTVSGNTATFVIDETYAAGHVGNTDVAYVKVSYGDTEITSTSRIRVTVLASATEGVEPAPAYETAIDQFLENAQEQVDEIIDEVEHIIDYTVPTMSASTKGGAKLGDGLNVDANTKLNVSPATTSTIGGVKPDGTSITVDNDGTIHGQAGGVTGVKGNEESTYRTGNVNLTLANIGAAASSHNHSASNITSGTLSVDRGGTGQTSIGAARAALGSIQSGYCDTSSTTANYKIFSVTLPDFTPFSGARIVVYFQSSQESTSKPLQLSINGGEAVTVYAGGLETSSTNKVTWSAYALCEFVYYSSHWHYLGNNIDGYEDYKIGTAVSDLATWTGASETAYTAYGTMQSQIDTLRDSVVFYNAVERVEIGDWGTFPASGSAPSGGIDIGIKLKNSGTAYFGINFRDSKLAIVYNDASGTRQYIKYVAMT